MQIAKTTIIIGRVRDLCRSDNSQDSGDLGLISEMLALLPDYYCVHLSPSIEWSSDPPFPTGKLDERTGRRGRDTLEERFPRLKFENS